MKQPFELDALKLFQDLIPEIVPVIGALAVSSLVILVSNSFNGSKKVIFQALLFSAGLAASLSYLLITNPNELKVFLDSFY